MLDGRVALITGSTRGIGWAVAYAVAQAGGTVVLHGHEHSPLLEERLACLLKISARHAAIPFDLASPVAIKAGFGKIFQRFNRLDILVNNAALFEAALVGMNSDASIDRLFTVNAQAPIRCMELGARLMARGGGGAIINIGSIMGTHGAPGQVLYSATKSALVGMTKAAAKELAPQNIRVNLLCPGFIDTDMAKSASPEQVANFLSTTAMGRIGKPEEVASVVVFLASSQSSYVTGQVIGVDGGMAI